MLCGLVTALRTLTVLPVPGKDTKTFSNSLYWFPMVGLLLGLFQAGVGYAVYLAGWNELSAALVVLSGVAITRGMHADGLADMADGFWGGKSKESSLRIMKDPNIGSFAALALSGMMLLKWIAVLKLAGSGTFGVIAGGVLLARWVQVLLASSLSYARNEGGTAQSFVNGAGWKHILLTSILTLTCLYPLLQFSLYPFVLAVLTAIAAGLLIGILSYRKIGGVTGDVLGAASEVTEVLVWITGAVLHYQH